MERDFEFTANYHTSGTFSLDDEKPAHEELLYLLPRDTRGGTGFVHLVRALAYARHAKDGREYDSGRSGKAFFILYSLGVVRFNDRGGLLVPEKDLGEVSSYDGGMLLRRTPTTDAMAFAAAKSIRGHEHARTELRAVVGNLQKVFSGLVPAQEKA